MVLVILTVVCGVALVSLAIHGEIRERQREVQRAVWPWARAYYALRDGRDENDDLPEVR